MTVPRELRRRLRADRLLPRFEPCLPRPAKGPPAGPDRIHEIKHDSFRILAELNAGADGAHIGQRDMPVALARQLLGPAAIIGLSITELGQVRDRDVELADYLGVGPIFAQSTKLDATPPLGLDGLAEVRRATGNRSSPSAAYRLPTRPRCGQPGPTAPLLSARS
jgi:hypothetical protein